MTYTVIRVEGDELTSDELAEQPSNGVGDKEFATYLRVIHNGVPTNIYNANMEPEDATFNRDLKWVAKALEEAYECGYNDRDKELGESEQ